MPITEGLQVIRCACGWEDQRTRWYRHIASDCPILRCGICLHTLQSAHPFPGPTADAAEDHTCRPAHRS